MEQLQKILWHLEENISLDSVIEKITEDGQQKVFFTQKIGNFYVYFSVMIESHYRYTHVIQEGMHSGIYCYVTGIPYEDIEVYHHSKKQDNEGYYDNIHELLEELLTHKYI